jgi:S-sulfo-L-cysteine synthase (O-acetyl-L-serine-dependent)
VALVDHIGKTPLVRLERITRGLLPPEVELWAKLESFNPGGSVKDRAAWSIIQDAEQSGRLKPGMVLLDSSSGNTGIAYGMIAAARGHQLVLCLPKNANRERKQLLAAYGVEVIETDPLAGSDGAITKARELVRDYPERYLYLDQYSNPANWLAHYHGTAMELWAQTQGRITHWVAGLGTTGTFVGTSRRLKELNPGIHCAAVQPDSPYHGLEGLKHLETAIVPGIYDPKLVDQHLSAPTEESILLLRRLAREEGILVGPSAAAALWGALQVGQNLKQGVVVTLFPDGGERYLSEAHLWN